MFFTGTHKERHRGAEQALMYAVIIAFIGVLLKLGSYYHYDEIGTFAWYAGGHLCICIAIAITVTISVLVSKFLWRDLFTLMDTFGAIPIGFVISFLITYAVYNDSDRFFTKSKGTATKNFWIMVVQALIIFFLFLYYWIRKCVISDDEEDHPVQTTEFFDDNNTYREHPCSRIV